MERKITTRKARKEWKTKIGTKNKGNKWKTETNMVHINPTISIITFNVSGLNASIKEIVLKTV